MKKPAKKAAKRKTAPKGAPGRTERVAAARAAGQSVSDIARAENISRQHASRIVNSDDTQSLIAAAVDRRAARFDHLLDRALDVIEASFEARKFGISKYKDANGDVCSESIELGADHFAALTGVKRLIELGTAGRPTPKLPEKKEEEAPSITYAQLEDIYNRYQAFIAARDAAKPKPKQSHDSLD